MTRQNRKTRLGLMAGLAFVACGPALPALAGSAFTPPKGCTGYLTVQMHGCIVSNHYKCDTDPKGDQWRVDFNQNGPFFVSRIDAETQWVETLDLAAGTHETLKQPSAAPASFSDLLAKGKNAYDFTTVTDDGKVEHVTGTDTLTGVTRVVSGVTLEQTDFDTTAKRDDGTLIWHSKGHEWIDRAWRLFLAGAGTWDDGSGPTVFDNTPVALIQPGSKGFMSSSPEFDCNSVESELVLPGQAGPVIR